MCIQQELMKNSQHNNMMGGAHHLLLQLQSHEKSNRYRTLGQNGFLCLLDDGHDQQLSGQMIINRKCKQTNNNSMLLLLEKLIRVLSLLLPYIVIFAFFDQKFYLHLNLHLHVQCLELDLSDNQNLLGQHTDQNSDKLTSFSPVLQVLHLQKSQVSASQKGLQGKINIYSQYAQEDIQCFVRCSSCLAESLYSCTSCKNLDDSAFIYLTSCQVKESSPLFIILCVLIVVLYIFTLLMGIGVYKNYFEIIQLTSLLNWGYGFQPGILTNLQGVNFGVMYGNSFSDTFAAQFLVCIFILIVFWLMLGCVERLPHSPTAILIKRKRITLPFRLLGLIYNIVFFGSLTQLLTLLKNSKIYYSILSMMLCVFALSFCFLTFFGFALLCNAKKYKIDDPNYYVLTEKMTSTSLWVKNNSFFSIFNRTILIIVFCVGFEIPLLSTILMIVFQAAYTVYMMFVLSWVKIRYKIFNSIGNVIFLGCLVCQNGFATADFESNRWKVFQNIYVVLVVILCGIFIIAEIIQIVAQRYYIKRTLASYVDRFILCKKIESKEEIQLTKYDGNHLEREEVTEFHDNPLYGVDLTKIRQSFT